MLNIGAGEMVLILVVALLVLGPTRLPELARGIGKFVREFRRQTDDVRSMVEREFYKMDDDLRRAETHAVPSENVAPALPGSEPQTDAAALATEPYGPGHEDPHLSPSPGHPEHPVDADGHAPHPEEEEPTVVGEPHEGTRMKPSPVRVLESENAPGSREDTLTGEVSREDKRGRDG
jgi:sec-independent protein translocase protein TatB